MKKWLAASTIILTPLYLACVGWLYVHHILFYRRIVLEMPIRFEEGFSFTRQFTVDTPTLYWVAIQYDEIFRSTIEVPTPRDEFTAECEVTSGDQVIAKGGTASAGDWSGGGPAPWGSNGDHVIRYLYSFIAEPGRSYQLSLRMTSAQPRLISKSPTAMIEVWRSFDEFRPLRESLLLAVGVVIAILIFVYSWSMLLSRRGNRTSPI